MHNEAYVGMGAGVSTDRNHTEVAVPGAEARHPGYDVAAWRARIPILKTHVALNSCSQGAQMESTRAAAEAYLDSWNRDGMDWEEWTEETYRAKVEFARLINASPDEIAVSTSTSEASASLISAFDPSGARRKIVSTEAEFPSISHVWMAFQKYGLQVDWVPVRDQIVHLEDYDRHLDDQTLLVSATHAYYQNGFKQDLAPIAEKAHAAGALLFVDAYQSLGTHPIDVKALDIDFLATGNLKYLMGVPGIAFLYARGDLHDRLHPAITGWFGRSNPYSFQPKVLDWSPTAARLETGTPPVINAYIARAGMAVINEIGSEAIRAWTADLSQYLIDEGRRRGFRLHGIDDAQRKSPSTAFFCPGNAHAIEAALKDRRILASARGPVIRLAPHFFSTYEDCTIALDALEEIFAEVPRD